MTFTKEQLQHIIETDHVQCGDASALARMALAGMEAEPVAWAHRLINKRNGVVHPWVYGSAEACPSEGDIFNIEVMPLYTAPPAPVSVPAAMEMDDDFDSAFEHGKAVGWNAFRAAMLQGAYGNSPVAQDGWTGSDEANAALIMPDRIETVDSVDDDRIEGIKRIIRGLAEAPQQECKHEFVYGWHSYGSKSGYQCRFCGKLQEAK